MSYDPFARGPYPVGVRSVRWRDPARAKRALTVELWYPAVDSVAGQDLARATSDQYTMMAGLTPSRQQAVRNAPPRPCGPGQLPVVLFSHGWGSHRRQSSFLCTHLASHGYLVAAPDHAGNTTEEMVQTVASGRSHMLPLREVMRLRPGDIQFVLDCLAAHHPTANTSAVGLAGHSFGGWTTLRIGPADPRVRAMLPLAPAGGTATDSFGQGEPLFATLSWSWNRPIPTLFIVADRDSLLPLKTMQPLWTSAPAPKQFVVLANTDHLHFCDDVERVHELFRLLPAGPEVPPASEIPPMSELCTGAASNAAVGALGLAHMDAYLRAIPQAHRFLATGWRAAFADRHIDYEQW